MKTALLRTATSRKIGYRRWDGLKLTVDTGHVGFGAAQFKPKAARMWFHWSFHKHPGGMGAKCTSLHRDDIRAMVINLMRHQVPQQADAQVGA